MAGRGFAPQTRPGAGAPFRLGAAETPSKRRAQYCFAILGAPTLSLLLGVSALLASFGFGSPRSLGVASGGSLGLAPPFGGPQLHSLRSQGAIYRPKQQCSSAVLLLVV